MRKTLLLTLCPHRSPLWIIFEINFLRNFSVALLTSIFALYIRKFFPSDAAVAAVFFTGYCAAFVSNIYSAHLIEHLKKRKALLLGLGSFSLLFGLFAYAQRSTTVLLLFTIYQFAFALIIFDIGLYIKHYSNLKTIAENQGKLGSLGNIAWILGPLLGSLIAEKYNFEVVFLLSSFFSLIALCSFFFVRLDHEDIPFPHARSFHKNIALFFKDKNLRKTYINNAGLGFIYSIWDYLPLLMTGIGATLPVIGMTKTLMGVPQAIFEYPLGQMADKETGERKLFIIGYALAFGFTALLGLTANLHLFIAFFFFAATGTSFLEMTRDSYFYRQMSEREVELISVYRTSDTLPYLVGQGLAVIFLSLAPLSWWFVIGGSAGIMFIINAWKLKNLKRSEP